MTGSELIQLSKVNYLLMSGDGRGDLNEVDAMINAAMQNGMPKDALVEDLYGFSTLDTCVNAARNFNVNNAILISQKFHLPRALYLCETVGIDSKGVIADKKVYSPMNSLLWFFREVFATTYSWLSIQFLRK